MKILWFTDLKNLLKRHKAGVAIFILFNIVVLSGIAAIIYQGRIAAEERDKAKIENQKFEKGKIFSTRNVIIC